MSLQFPDVQVAEWPSKTCLHPAWSPGSNQKYSFPVPQGKSKKESAKLLRTGVTGASKWKENERASNWRKVYIIITEVFCSQFGVSVQCQKPSFADPVNDRVRSRTGFCPEAQAQTASASLCVEYPCSQAELHMT
jgi:hypothetical protein